MNFKEPATVVNTTLPHASQSSEEVSVARATSLFSDYLDDGFRKDKLELFEALIENKNVMHVKLRLLDWDNDSQGEFHLSAQTAIRWTQQLAIVFACIDQGLTEKPGEVYLKRISIEFRRLVKSTCDPIRFKLEIINRATKKKSTTYEMRVSINEESFVSTGVFRFPMRLENALQNR